MDKLFYVLAGVVLIGLLGLAILFIGGLLGINLVEWLQGGGFTGF